MREAFRLAYPSGRPWWRHIVAPVNDPWTYLRALHLFFIVQVALPYVVALVVLVSVGMMLIWTWFGPALLLLALYLSRWAGDVEAWLIRRVHRVELRRPPTAIERDQPFRSQVWTRLSDPTTWTGLVYLLAQLPFGIVAFLIVIGMSFFSVTFTIAPLFIGPENPLDFGVMPGGERFVIDDRRDAWWLPLAGSALMLSQLHLVNVLSAVHAGWARLMLGSRAPHIAPRSPLDPGAPTGPDGHEDNDGPGRPAPSPLPGGGSSVVAAQDTAHPITEEASALALASLATLTPRELNVLRLIARGYSNAEIAEALVVSEGTVKSHVKRVLAKLSVRDRTQAAVFAYEHRVVLRAVEERAAAELGRQAAIGPN
jgi:RNA polymerase sigma factor (sigma-70 family)